MEYQGILLFVDKSGIRTTSPTAFKPDPSTAVSIKEGIVIQTLAKPVPCSLTTSLKRFPGTAWKRKKLATYQNSINNKISKHSKN